MNAEHQQGMVVRDVELETTCVACGGTVSARFMPGSARGVCLTCHLLTPMTLVRVGEGVRAVQWAVGNA